MNGKDLAPVQRRGRTMKLEPSTAGRELWPQEAPEHEAVSKIVPTRGYN